MWDLVSKCGTIPRTRRRAAALALALLSGGSALAIDSPPAAAAVTGCARGQGGDIVRDIPWPQTMIAPERAWPFSTGKGVTVAVLDSGVDASFPQLSGAVLAGYDLVHNGPSANTPCGVRGTAVASLIAARALPGVGFRGFAPAATILPVRIGEDELDNDQLDDPSLSPDHLGEAIRWATDHGADVVDLSTTLYIPSERLDAEIQYAYRHGVLVVAPVGDDHADHPPDPVPYPAALDHVVGVGAVDSNGLRSVTSQVGGYVDLVAPGVDVLGAASPGGYDTYSGTGFATAFVSATIALIEAAFPSASVDEVYRRLLATASASPGSGDAYGAGLIDPYRAVTEVISSAAPAHLPRVDRPQVDRAALARAARRAAAAKRASWYLIAGIAAAVVAIVAACCVPLGRRRRWRAGQLPAEPSRSLDDDIAMAYRAPLTTKEFFTPATSTKTRR